MKKNEPKKHSTHSICPYTCMHLNLCGVYCSCFCGSAVISKRFVRVISDIHRNVYGKEGLMDDVMHWQMVMISYLTNWHWLIHLSLNALFLKMEKYVYSSLLGSQTLCQLWSRHVVPSSMDFAVQKELECTTRPAQLSKADKCRRREAPTKRWSQQLRRLEHSSPLLQQSQQNHTSIYRITLQDTYITRKHSAYPRMFLNTP